MKRQQPDTAALAAISEIHRTAVNAQAFLRSAVMIVIAFAAVGFGFVGVCALTVSASVVSAFLFAILLSLGEYTKANVTRAERLKIPLGEIIFYRVMGHLVPLAVIIVAMLR